MRWISSSAVMEQKNWVEQRWSCLKMVVVLLCVSIDFDVI